MTSDGVSAANKIWLIKSSTRILGPYNIDEVTALLVSSQVTVLDEIRQSDGRWEYIRESKYFLDVVKNVRNLQDKKSDKTMTSSTAQQTTIKTDSNSIGFDDNTPAPGGSQNSYRIEQSSLENIKLIHLLISLVLIMLSISLIASECEYGVINLICLFANSPSL